jgi:hypothetical protein
VRVGATRNGGLATRACGATLSWDKRDLLVVSEASQVDIDVLGGDLGLDTPVVAFQVKRSEADWSMEYRIYSLQKPPQLLRTIKGGDYFSAADTDLQGSIEIWTSDASAINGFENLSLGELDFAPSIAMRFERRRLIDVSSEFRAHFDDQIAGVRARLDPQELIDFKNSDGKLPAMSPLPLERLHRLRITKIKVLEIVWSYLYSGREEDAVRNLSEMWPPADFERIRSSLLSVRDHGIRTQIDGVSARTARVHKKPVQIYNEAPDRGEHPPDPDATTFAADTKPQGILLLRPVQNQEDALPKSKQMVDLVIDAAGKVRSAHPGEGFGDMVPGSANWKFIPAFKNGHAVASRLHFGIRFLQ